MSAGREAASPAGRLVVRLVGGLGNQMFGYAAALRLAEVNDAELVVDAVTGFENDTVYRRRYALEAFDLSGRLATPAERLEPMSRLRWKVMRAISARRPFGARRLILQDGMAFDRRLLDVRFKGTRYIEGVWPSEGYFTDVSDLVRRCFAFRSGDGPDLLPSGLVPPDREPVAVHVRYFAKPGSAGSDNAPVDYYRRAIAEMRRRVSKPHFVIFSDDPRSAAEALALEPDCFSVSSSPADDPHGVIDHGRMRGCRHFIIANSTFSWWGAWMGGHPGKIVIAPSVQTVPAPNWNIPGFLPGRWLTL